ncbi:MAG TPA: MBG domain-containing protein [Verrucomicrobiae bacterium]|nr:MBG domain-containing protein [Verrucomicrobiae bacterium]
MKVRKTGGAYVFAFCLSILLPFQTRANVNITPASGGNAIPADRAANAPTPAWTSLGAITISEPGNSRGDIGGGTLVLNAPAGFEFNPTLLPNVSFTSGRNIVSAIGTVSSSNITITLVVLGSDETDTLTIGGSPAIQIRPLEGTPLASGNIYRPATGGGTAVIDGLNSTDNPNGSGGSNLGTIRSVSGAASQLTAQALPSGSAVAGTNFSPQAAIQVRDQFGNIRNSANGAADNSTVVTASLVTGTSTLQGTTNVTAANGTAAFGNLSYRKAETISLRFSSGSLSNVLTDDITITPGPASRLAFTAQPISTVYGLPLSPQPVVVSQDAFGNSSVTDLGASKPLSLSLSTGTGPLLGTTSLDIGTDFGNGVATFTNIQIPTAGLEKRLSASAAGMSDGVSSAFDIQPATVTAIVGVSNKVYDGLATATIVNRALTGVLGTDDLTLSGGAAFFADENAGAGKTVTITNLVLTGTASNNYQLAASTVLTTANITKAPLTVTADNKHRFVGQDNPPLTATYLGFVNGETLGTSGITGSPALSTTADANSPAGYYPIVTANGSLSSVNYNLLFANGVLGVIPSDASFFDDFSRTNDPGDLAPWEAPLGNWTVTSGLLKSGTNALQSYGYAIITNSWSNYTVEGLIKFSPRSFGGGVGGRLNPATGSQYVAWVYPENSSGGSNVLKLIKFNTYTTYSYLNVAFAPMQQVYLPGVGTNWHALRLSFLGNQISVAYDGNEVISVTDVEPQLPFSGGISVAMWTDAATDQILVESVYVKETGNIPVANNNNYSVVSGETLTVAAPGVLGNDSGSSLSAVLLATTTQGTLNLNSDGGFTYTPNAQFIGTDTFTYRASDGQTNSNIATVSIIVTETGVLFADDFSRGEDPGPLSPWIPYTGNWMVSAGALNGGANPPQAYGFAHINGNWNDYSVEGRLRFPSGGYGGGLGGRLNPATGAHYGAWIYPEGSSGGSNVLKLIKFSNWTTFGYNGVNLAPIQQVNLPGVGTNWHTLKVTFQTNQIRISYDGNEVLNVGDIEAQPPLLTGGISADMWTDAAPYVMAFDDVVVRTLTTSAGPPGIVGIQRDGNLVTITFSGTPGATYTIQASTNLALPEAWQTISTNTAAANGQWTFLESTTNYRQRYFRSAKP